MSSNIQSNTYTCFGDHNQLACGSIQTVSLAVKRAYEDQTANSILVFDDATGRLVNVDVRGSDADILARLDVDFPPVAPSTPQDTDNETDGEPRGRGRPKLGVVPREVTLLPRHWEWLASQPGGASVALRKLVEEARRASAERDQKRTAQERAYRFMSAVAGDFENFEEASRALFADDAARFRQLVTVWPDDIRAYTLKLMGTGDMAANSDLEERKQQK